jgi:hypothetical protein
VANNSGCMPTRREPADVADTERIDATMRAVSLKGGDRVLTPDGPATVRYHKDIGRIVGVRLDGSDTTTEEHPWNVEPVPTCCDAPEHHCAGDECDPTCCGRHVDVS